jgi:hypothetical protein
MAKLIDKFKFAWNAFVNDTPNERTEPFTLGDFGASYSGRPDRNRLRFTNERSIISAIYNRISIDVASIEIRHVRLDENNRYAEDIDSGLNNCLTVEANIDQAARMFRQDMVMSMLSEGIIAVVPVDTTLDPNISGGFDIQTMRVGKVVQWKPRHVQVNTYNERNGKREDITLEKRIVAIAENPLYSVMNEQNSTLQRLIRKINMLDTVDEQTSSGKLDLIIQLPYVIKSDARRQQAEQRRTDIEVQLKGSKYGIAYTDGTEKITQLNRPVENNLLAQVEYLTNMLYAQLGITAEVMNGTANEATMLNYNNRTIEPILGAIVEAMRRTFLTKTARTQKQSIDYFRDPFKLVPMSDLAELADKLGRNEIVTANEFRGFIGMKPAADPKADQLVNSNMPQAVTGVPSATDPAASVDPAAAAPADPDVLSSSFDDIDSAIDDAFSGLGLDDGSPADANA